MKGIKVCYAIQGLGVGGAEKLVVNLANYYNDDNEVTVVIFSNARCLAKDLINGVRLVEFELSLGGVLNFIKFCNSNKFDLIHSHMYLANFLSRIATLICKNTINISSVHNTTEAQGILKKYLLAMIYRLTDFAAALTTNVSQKATEEFLGKKSSRKSKVKTLYNGLSFTGDYLSESRVSIFEENTLNLCSVGSLTHQKGYEVSLEAVSLLLRSGLDVRYLIVGAGPLEGKLNQLVEKLGISNNVEFYGLADNVLPLIYQSDVFVLPSHWEGFGLVLLEAIFCNRTILATKCDGPIQILGSNYPLFFEGAEELADKLLSLQNKHCSVHYDRDFILNKFSFSNMIENLNLIYSNAVFKKF